MKIITSEEGKGRGEGLPLYKHKTLSLVRVCNLEASGYEGLIEMKTILKIQAWFVTQAR